jgi:hypothetical protein
VACYVLRRGGLWAMQPRSPHLGVGLTVALPSHYPCHLDTLDHLGLIHLATAAFCGASPSRK